MGINASSSASQTPAVTIVVSPKEINSKSVQTYSCPVQPQSHFYSDSSITNENSKTKVSLTHQVQNFSEETNSRIGRSRGLLATRRGSHTSLTISIASSMDSVSSNICASMQSDLETLYTSSHVHTSESLKEMFAQQPHSLQCSPLYFHDRRILASSPAVKQLCREFNELPMNYARSSDFPIGGVGAKNRYEIFLNEESRVNLPNVNGDLLSTYINANFVNGYPDSKYMFIATQGPMQHTIVDFWRMIWAYDCRIIVMITNIVEKNKKKCENYLPSSDCKTFGDIKVSVMIADNRENYIVRVLKVQDHTGIERIVYHFWYTCWLDQTTPNTAPDLIRLIHDCRYCRTFGVPGNIDISKYNVSNQLTMISSPIVVHCSAGLGRTGCFIALWNACDQIIAEQKVNPLQIVAKMRLQRGGSVQTFEQYVFLHETILYWWMNLSPLQS